MNLLYTYVSLDNSHCNIHKQHAIVSYNTAAMQWKLQQQKKQILINSNKTAIFQTSVQTVGSSSIDYNKWMKVKSCV